MSQPFFPGQPNQPQAPYGPAGYSPNPSPVYAPSPYPQPSPTNGYAGASLLIGIISVILVFAPFVGVVGLIGGVAAIILGAIGARKTTSKGISIGGIVLGVLTVLIGVIAIIITAVAIRGATAVVTVDYAATVSTGSARVSYTVDGSIDDYATFTGSWSESESIRMQTSQGFVMLNVNGDDPDQIVTCEIKVNGKVVNSDSGPYSVGCDATLT